ncbi:hypothetical protein TIFTF001_020892 [Ficus carica]|uniref:Uncharacterized protein n=1 Tax=Ficus carica TaxID=3494 RepID=A0AA88A9H9_FICCA|nr:hypothetical protein TIFTF001_020892 [Ficus carica]
MMEFHYLEAGCLRNVDSVRVGAIHWRHFVHVIEFYLVAGENVHVQVFAVDQCYVAYPSVCCKIKP